VSGSFEKGFEDQENMLTSYAGHDHRLNGGKAEKV
jgi:hypothetical protein